MTEPTQQISPSASKPGAGGASPARVIRHWLVFAGAASAMATGQFIYLSASILNPLIAESLGASLSEVAIYNSLLAIGGVPAMMLIGPALFRKVGVRTGMIVGSLWLAASLAAAAFVNDLLSLWLLGGAAGLTFGLLYLGGSILITNWFHARRGTIMGAAFAVSGLGGMAAGLALPPVVTQFDWRAGFLFLAGLTVVAVVVPGFALVRSTPRNVGLRPWGLAEAQAGLAHSAATDEAQTGRKVLRSAQFVALSVALVFIGLTQALEMHYAPVMMEHGVTLEVAGLLMAVMALATVGTNVLVGAVNDRRGTGVAVGLALVCQSLAFATLALAGGFPLLAAGGVLFAFGLAVTTTLIPILILRLFGMRDFTKALGPANAMQPAGLALGTPLWGLSVDLTGSYSAALVGAAVVTLLACTLLLWALRTTHRKASC